MNFPADINGLLADHLTYVDIYHLCLTCKIYHTNFKSLIYQRINWLHLSTYGRINEAFILANLDNVRWGLLIPHLPTNFIIDRLPHEYLDIFNDDEWRLISKYQNLSNKFINRYADCLDWKHISKYHKFTINSVREHIGRIYEYKLLSNPSLTEDMILELKTITHQYIKSNKLSDNIIRYILM